MLPFFCYVCSGFCLAVIDFLATQMTMKFGKEEDL